MIRELKTLVAVAKEGTFAAAGNKIGVTQAAVSAQMQRLENELGFKIFDRSARTAQLNSRGHQVLDQAQELIRLYGKLGSRKSDAVGITKIQVGAIASAQRTVLPDVLAKFHKQLGNCRTRVVPGLSMHLVELVDAGEIDFAIVIRPPFSLQSDLRWTILAEEPFRLLVPRQTRGRDWGELLTTEPFVRYDRTSFGGRQVDRFLRDWHIDVREVCEVDELDAIVRLVERGVGVALVPQTAAFKRWPAAVRALDLGERTFHRDIGLIERANQNMSEPARRLGTMICSAYRQRVRT